MGLSIRRERLEWELRALDAAGYRHEIVSGAVDSPAEVHVRVWFPRADRETPLEVYFPVLYPFFRFQIDAPELDLPHHQNPLQRNLCLIGRGTDRWSRTNTLVDFLAEQVEQVITAGLTEDRDLARELEQPQAEPFSEYYPYSPNATLVIDGNWRLPDTVRGGSLTLGLLESTPPAPLRAVVLDVRDDSENILARSAEPLVKLARQRRTARWVRTDKPIQNGDPSGYFREISRFAKEVVKQRWQPARDGSFQAVASLFPEEHEWRDGHRGLGWTSVVRFRRKRGQKRRARVEHHFVRVTRAGRDDFRERVPETSFLAEHKISVVGLGCIGAPAAICLAQAGVGHLHLVDGDTVDPGTTVRWPLGVSAYGKRKAESLGQFIARNWPYTEVSGAAWRLGDVRRGQSLEELDIVEAIYEDTSLVLDLTAEHGVQRFLSEVTRDRGIPYVWGSGTPGGWGGFIGRVVTSEDACWGCIETAAQEGEIMAPAADPRGRVQPAGCGDVTFTGSGFDMQMVSLAAVRMAVATLSSGADSYPPRDWNVEVMNLRDAEGNGIAPQCVTALVPRRPDCAVCGQDA